MIGILALILTNFFSGFFVYRFFFRKTNFLELLILPQLFSLILTPVELVLLNLAVGFDFGLLAFPFVVIITTFISLRWKQNIEKILIDKKSFAVAALIVLFIAVSLIIYFEATLNSTQVIGDYGFHVTTVNQIKNFKTLPPNMATLYGEPIVYQWFYHLSSAAQISLLGIPESLFAPYTGTYIGILAPLGLLLIGYNYLKNWKGALLYMFIFALYFRVQLAVPSPQMYTLDILILLYFLILKYLKENSDKIALLIGLVTASIIYMHGLSFVFASISLFSFAVYKIIFHGLRKSLKTLVFMLGPMVLSLPYYLLISPNLAAPLLVFVPFSGLLLDYFTPYSFLIFPFLFGVYKAIKKKESIEVAFFLLFISAIIFLFFFQTVRNPGIERIIVLAGLPFSFVVFFGFKDMNKMLKYFFIVAAVIFMLNNMYQATAQFWFTPRLKGSEEFQVATWIKENTKLNEIAVTEPHSIYSSISERQCIVCDPLNLISTLSNPKEQFADLIMLYTNPSKDLFDKYNARLVVIGYREKEFFNKYDLKPFNFDSAGFEKVYSIGSYSVYKLVDSGKISQKQNMTIRENLNFTSYSRWWQV